MNLHKLARVLSLVISGLCHVYSLAQTSDTIVDVQYYDDKLVMSRTQLVGGMRNGWHREYDIDGALEYEAFYVNDQLHGVERRFCAKKVLCALCTYSNGVKHGVEIVYYENGRLQKRSQYLAGIQNGIEVEYTRKGKPRYINYYANGSQLEYTSTEDLQKFVRRAGADSVRFVTEVADGVYATREKKTGKWGMYQKLGREHEPVMLVPMQYDSLDYRGSVHAVVVWLRGKAGVFETPFVTGEARELISPQYEKMQVRRNDGQDFVAAKKNGLWGQVHLPSGKEADFIYQRPDEIVWQKE